MTTPRRLPATLLIILYSLFISPVGAQAQSWGNISYDGAPWVDNVSRPFTISKGLYNRHLTVWASHGRYYDNQEDGWRWQRPTLFGTSRTLSYTHARARRGRGVHTP